MENTLIQFIEVKARNVPQIEVEKALEIRGSEAATQVPKIVNF